MESGGGENLILGVAFSWGYAKGLDVFIKLAGMLDEKYRIMLVGTTAEIDSQLPSNIISIHKTNNSQELAVIYSAADVFVNPTREEVLGLTNVEALACGTPVVSFDTGGCKECLDINSGVVVEKNNINALYEQIIRICSKRRKRESV